MYLDAFDLSDYPFIQSSKDELYFTTEQNAKHTILIHHWLESGHGMLLVSGRSGTGRSSLLFQSLETSDLQIDKVVVGGSGFTRAEILQYLALELGIKSTSSDFISLRHSIKQHLRAAACDDRRICLVFEKAELLEPATLEMLQDLSVDRSYYLPLCMLALVGDKSMGRAVRKSVRTEQAHDVAHVLEVKALKEPETRDYIAHRLAQVSHAKMQLFSPAILRHIHKQSAGHPASINMLCDQALVQAAIEAADSVTQQHIKDAVRHLGWRAVKGGAEPRATRRVPRKRSGRLQTNSGAPDGPGALERSVHQLIRDVTTIGRAADCSIRIDESDISPCQALIVKTEDGMFIRSEGGESPIYLNASPVDTANLRDGDTLNIGNYELSLSTDTEGTPTLTSIPPLSEEESG